MAVLAVQEIVRAGLAPAYTACAAGGDSFANPGNAFIHIKNANGSAATLTIVTPKTVDGLAVADRTVSIPATSGDVMIGPLPAATYNDASGNVSLTYSAVTDLTIGIVKLGTA